MIKSLSLAFVILVTATVGAQGDYSELYSNVEKSVVPIFTHSKSTAAVGNSIQQVDNEGLGTGFIVSSDGIILTASHVINTADALAIQYEGTIYECEILRNSVQADVALIKMKYPPARLPFLKLGDSDLVKIGEEIVIIGYPFGLGKSLSVGHIGGFHKVDEIVDVELFQTDGSINVGNSGGPVFNTAGEVVGIVSSIYSKSGGFDGVGFIATINMVKKHLIERQNPWLGLDAMLVNGALSRALNIPASGGILVENVADFSPADEMGLHGGNIPVNILGEEIILGGDIIIAIDSLPCATPEDLVNITKLMDSKKNGDVIKVKVIRGAVVKTLNWAIRKQPLPEIGK